MLYKLKIALNRFFSSQLFITIIGLVVFFVILFPLIKNLKQRQKIDTEINNLKKEIAVSEAKNSQLRDILDYIESDQFVEEQARLNLGLKRNGEKVAVITDLNVDANSSVGNQDMYIPTNNQKKDEVKIKMNNFKNWWLYFFDNES